MGWPLQRKEDQTSSEPLLEPLSDCQYQSLLFELLNGTAIGWSPEQVKARLGSRKYDPLFIAWLWQFGQCQLASQESTHGLGLQMIKLATVITGELGTVAQLICEQLLSGSSELMRGGTVASDSTSHDETTNALAFRMKKRRVRYHFASDRLRKLTRKMTFWGQSSLARRLYT